LVVLRPGPVVAGSIFLALAGIVVLLWPADSGWAGRAAARPLSDNEDEIAWLNPATSSLAWDRFVTAVRRLQSDGTCPQVLLAPSSPYPEQSTAVPEFALSLPGGRRLIFRWYKLTGEVGSRDWIEAFCNRPRPPLAVIGGSSSDRARELAQALASVKASSPPLFLITTATADRSAFNEPLMDIYRGRTWRYCFTNRQMAEAIADFIWSRTDLRPDAAPVYLTAWQDDPYSRDLAEQFHETIGPEGQAGAWANSSQPFWSASFPYSIGSFTEPNRWETEGAGHLIDELSQHPSQKRPLLVLTATPQPARRFLRALLREAPAEAQRFVVATGDAIDFNTIYRDRDLLWPIQDFPIPLVSFCHRNPVDPSAFTPTESTEPPSSLGRSSTGTQDLLLYRDIAATVIRAWSAGAPPANADELASRLRDPSVVGIRFGDNGDLLAGAGEYVVTLRPDVATGRVWPRAHLQVWTRSSDNVGRASLSTATAWQPVAIAGRPELIIDYGVSPSAPAARGTD
jgi:hypothetical protein